MKLGPDLFKQFQAQIKIHSKSYFLAAIMVISGRQFCKQTGVK